MSNPEYLERESIKLSKYLKISRIALFAGNNRTNRELTLHGKYHIWYYNKIYTIAGLLYNTWYASLKK